MPSTITVHHSHRSSMLMFYLVAAACVLTFASGAPVSNKDLRCRAEREAFAQFAKFVITQKGYVADSHRDDVKNNYFEYKRRVDAAVENLEKLENHKEMSQADACHEVRVLFAKFALGLLGSPDINPEHKNDVSESYFNFKLMLDQIYNPDSENH